MADDLNEIRERLQWCEGRIEAFVRELDAFVGSEFVADVTRGSNWEFKVLLTMKTEVPFHFKAEASSILHELRASLDSLVCTLAARNGRSASSVYFPIMGSQERFELEGKKALAKLSAADREKILSIRPYRGGNDDIFGLHEFDKKGKHRKLVAQTSNNSVLLDGKGLPFLGSQQIRHCGFDGIDVHWMDIHTPKLKVNCPVLVAEGRTNAQVITPVIIIRFVEPIEIAGYHVSGLLRVCHGMVSATVAMFD